MVLLFQVQTFITRTWAKNSALLFCFLMIWKHRVGEEEMSFTYDSNGN